MNNKNKKISKLFFLALISMIFLVLMIYLASADACTDWGGERTVISASSQCNVWADGYNGMTCTINGASRQCIRGKYPNDDWNVICCEPAGSCPETDCEDPTKVECGKSTLRNPKTCSGNDPCPKGTKCTEADKPDCNLNLNPPACETLTGPKLSKSKCKDNSGYEWIPKDKQEEKCEKTGGSFVILPEIQLEKDDVESNKDSVCCRTINDSGASTDAAKSPVAAGGDLFGICFGQMGDIWTKGFALVEVSDPKQVEELKKTIILNPLQGQKDKGGNQVYQYQVGVTLTECLFNYASIIYGLTTSIILTAQGDDRQIGTCANEKPLPGSTYCKTCNEDPYRLCTKERCQILGKCIALPDTDNLTGEYRCEDGACEEKGDIDLTRIDAHWYGDTEEIGNKTSKTGSQKGTVKLELGTTLKPNEIAWNTKSIKITIKTAELAQCKYILDRANSNFSEMTDFDDNYYPQDNEQSVIIPIEGDVSRNMTHIVYIKCNNLCNLPHAPSYDYNQVKFRLEKKPDQLPPEIIFIDPASNSVLSSELDYINASFWLDEIGTCKFSDLSINFTNNYNDSREQMMIPFGQVSPNSANSSIESGGCYKAKCLDRNEQCSRCWLKLNPDKGYEIINSTNPEFNETKLYHLLIRCHDGRNIMSEDKILDYLLMTAPPYKVNITKPEEQQKDYDDTPAIEVTTGIRNTQCKYKIYPASSVPREPPKWENMTFIDNAIATIHTG